MSKPKEKATKRKAKWVEGSVQKFLSLSDADTELIETRLAVSRLLKATRQEKKMTQAAAAAALHTSQSRLAKMEAAILPCRWIFSLNRCSRWASPDRIWLPLCPLSKGIDRPFQGLLGCSVSVLAVFAVEYDLLPHTSEPSITHGRPLIDYLCCEIIAFTTVGYGDIVPRTAQGKLLAICTALLGATHGVTFVALVSSGFDPTPTCQKSRMIERRASQRDEFVGSRLLIRKLCFEWHHI